MISWQTGANGINTTAAKEVGIRDWVTIVIALIVIGLIAFAMVRWLQGI